ncbi:hypothetical protein C0Q70_20135 [Pomacea canaliculata]|uniref:RIIa domain-containing protein n=1 Tax=Pomacea canaliculata TaxID=400727 RepID=A0A2T7NES4_POMCA|nr:hypothetical protein C0Q70_20135 [Pomacea canaliculata]
MANQPKHKAPEGMEPYDLEGKSDLGALSTEQQEKLNQFKCILAGFLGEALIKRPEDIREFAAEYFTSVDLPGKVQKQLEDRQAVLKQNRILQKI